MTIDEHLVAVISHPMGCAKTKRNSEMSSDVMTPDETFLVDGDPRGGAWLSECKQYRYRLWRSNDTGKGRVCFVMLNPSTADALIDDPTIRKCKYFARTWGFRHLVVVNLFSYRATDPKELLKVEAPVGAATDRIIREAALSSEMVVCAWGRLPPKLAYRQSQVLHILDGRTTVHCLGLNSDLSPKHPLYLKNTTQPKGWRSTL